MSRLSSGGVVFEWHYFNSIRNQCYWRFLPQPSAPKNNLNLIRLRLILPGAFPSSVETAECYSMFHLWIQMKCLRIDLTVINRNFRYLEPFPVSRWTQQFGISKGIGRKLPSDASIVRRCSFLSENETDKSE